MSHELIKSMLDDIQADNHADAQQTFLDLIGSKMTDALDQRKEEIAQQLGAFNGDVQTNS